MNQTVLHAGAPDQGLRSRKKARRRDEIISVARSLFAEQGIDATTMADIAAAAGISAPTVFSYFGSKDGVLIALINEGVSNAREIDRDLYWNENADLQALIIALFLRVSRRTLEIASKRVWRYAESAAIRHPETELARRYVSLSRDLIEFIAEFLKSLDLKTHSGDAPNAIFLAQLFHDVWMQCFLQLITNPEQTLAEHETAVRERLHPLIELLFDKDSVSKPRSKGTIV